MNPKPWYQSTTVLSVLVLILGAVLLLADSINFEQFMAFLSIGLGGAAFGVRRQMGPGLSK